MRIPTILLALMVASASAGEGDTYTSPYTARIKTTLRMLNLDDPASDVRANVAFGDFRFVGVTDYSCNAPIRGESPLRQAVERYGLRCLDGTTDMIEGEEYVELARVARGYAIAYNQALYEHIISLGSNAP